MKGLPVLGEALAGVATLALAMAAVRTAAPDRMAAAVALAGALVWSTIPLVVHLWMMLGLGVRPDDRADCDQLLARKAPAPLSTGTVTALVRLGSEPIDVARTTILLAAGSVPTMVLAVDRDVPDEIGRLDVVIHAASTLEDAVAAALAQVNTHAVLLVSGRAVPRTDACERAAGLLRHDTGWAIGRTSRFTVDSFVVDTREDVTAALCHDARRCGVDLWEPDATLVRADLLRNRPIEGHQPLGIWLRDRRAEGFSGVLVDDEFALRAAPVDADAYWPDAFARQSGRVADLVALTAAGQLRQRLVGAGLLARELFAYPALVWLATAVFIGSTGSLPFDAPAGAAILGAASTALLRWYGLRRALGLPMRPRRDLASAMHHWPSSLAVIAVIARRTLPRSSRRFTTRPLVWGAVALTAVIGTRLIASSGSDASNLGVALSLTILGSLWVFNMSALATKDWERNTYRIPLDLELMAGGVPCRTLNASPSGLAVVADGDGANHAVGARLPIAILLDDHSAMCCEATVAGRRLISGRSVLGFTLQFDEGARSQWIDQLGRGAARHRSEPDPASTVRLDDPIPKTNAERIRLIRHRIAVGVILSVSVSVIGALALVMLGYSPLVIRSGSMRPALAIGDIVVSEQVLAADLEPGDIATLPAATSQGDDSMTHRVVSVTTSPAIVLVATKGDANPTGETSGLAPDAVVTRVAWTIPRLGSPLTLMRTSGTAAGAAAGLVGMLALLALRRRHRQPHRQPDQ